jgi:hypothetical protein
MTQAEKLIWAAAFVQRNQRMMNTSGEMDHACAEVRRYRHVLASVRTRQARGATLEVNEALILEFADEGASQHKACRHCRGVAFKDGQCVGCGWMLER